MAEQRRGVLYGLAAYLLWGLFPLYWPLLEPSRPVEILAHRVSWSLVVVLLVLAVTRRWAWLRTVSARQVGLLSTAAVLVAVNWGVYIWAVNAHHVVETSLGYFINPLVSVMLGVLVLHERLRRVQWAAVALGAVAVAVLTVDFGRVPYVALVLAFSFGLYGLLKKLAGVGPVESLSLETAVLVVPAVGYLVVLGVRGTGTFGRLSTGHSLLLALTGLVTAIPLLFFGAAAVRVPLRTVGLLQYLAPVLQLLVGVGIRHEPMPPSRLVGFVLVWCALAMLSADALRERHRSTLATRAGGATEVVVPSG